MPVNSRRTAVRAAAGAAGAGWSLSSSRCRGSETRHSRHCRSVTRTFAGSSHPAMGLAPGRIVEEKLLVGADSGFDVGRRHQCRILQRIVEVGRPRQDALEQRIEILTEGRCRLSHGRGEGADGKRCRHERRLQAAHNCAPQAVCQNGTVALRFDACRSRQVRSRAAVLSSAGFLMSLRQLNGA